ncbi:pentatricopeptide repeat-containing protein At4g18975, chloroplastic [Aristolochia californica]|uniref:pentatricopeptide repeat-containing protein At4g18975, chloroplastic n=1 Tax=Aristolochia californica TaxID=171875 RepID=UPI0035E23C88
MLGGTMVLYLGKSSFLCNSSKMAESGVGLENLGFVHFPLEKKVKGILAIAVGGNQDVNRLTHQQKVKRLIPCAKAAGEKERKVNKKAGKAEHHLWMKRDSAGAGTKALNLVQIVSKLPNERELIYGALDKWAAFETEFPLIAAAKALSILRRRKEWLRLIQVTKWLLSKGQGMSMGTYDTLLLAFDMDGRVDEAESVWNMILQRHTRSVSRRLFSRMISLYDHHHLPDKILEVFADMEELGVKPDEDTVRRIRSAFRKLDQEEKEKLLMKKYAKKWKYLHFKGERVRVRTGWEE